MGKSIFAWSNLILLLFAGGHLYATSYYVSTASSGSASGNSWTNKQVYTSFTWTKLAGGDTVYFDGGSDSITYSSYSINTPPRYTSTVVVAKGKDAGHNGKVIFQSPSNSYGGSLILLHCYNMKFTGITINVGYTDNLVKSRYVLLLEFCKNITIDNSEIISNGMGYALWMAYDTSCTISNNCIESLRNSVNEQNDPIYMNLGAGGHTFIGNRILGGGDSQYDHKDLFQAYQEGSTSNPLLFTIANNIFIHCQTSPDSLCEGIYMTEMLLNRMLVYNNIITGVSTANFPFLYYGTSTYNTGSVKYYNNTFYGSGINDNGVQVGLIDTFYMKNNITFFNNSGGSWYSLGFIHGSSSSITVKEIDYNQYYRANGSFSISDNGAGLSWTAWQSLGYDLHSSTSAVTFANKGGYSIADYKLVSGSAGIDAGTDLSKYFTTDIIGTTRPQGSAFDRGALENISEINNNPTPTMGSISPTTTVVGGTDLVLTVTGTNFISSSVVQFNGTFLATTYINGTSLKATIPSSLLTSARTANITVVSPTPGGGTTTAKTFTITIANNPTPTIGSISPTTTAAGSANLVITVTGTNFISSSVVQFNGTSLATTYINSTSLKVTIPSSLLTSAGIANITVISPTPGGGTTTAKIFTISTPNNPTPIMGSIFPTTAVAGSTDLVLTVTGTNFISASEVQYNGSSLTTSYVSATRLTAIISTALLSNSGTANITVISPAPSGGTTAAKTFTITAPIGGGGTIPQETLKLTALLESYYVASGTQMTLAPWVTIELHNATAPYAMVDSNSAVLSTTGFGTFIFTNAVSGTNYYLVVKSINTIETWSDTALSFTSSTLSYDFTSAVTQAFTDGSNPPLALHNGKYCIYSGDLNHDGFINKADYAGVDNDNAALTYHLVNDLNGDGYVTSADDQTIDNNNLISIHRQSPTGTSGNSILPGSDSYVQKNNQ
jgi:hypothetical protein